MKQSQPVQSLAEADKIIWANVKGPKFKDYLGVARALSYVKRQPGYGSDRKVAERYPISREMVREFISLLQLPEEILTLYESKMLTLEHGRKLLQVQRARPAVLHEVVEHVSHLSSHEARDLIVHLLRFPDLTGERAKEDIMQSRKGPRREFHVVTIVDQVTYDALVRHARDHHVGVSEFVGGIVKGWLAER